MEVRPRGGQSARVLLRLLLPTPRRAEHEALVAYLREPLPALTAPPRGVFAGCDTGPVRAEEPPGALATRTFRLWPTSS